MALELVLWNLVSKFFHQKFKNIVDFGEDVYVCKIGEWGLLKVDDDQLLSGANCRKRNIVDWSNSEARTNADHEIISVEN